MKGRIWKSAVVALGGLALVASPAIADDGETSEREREVCVPAAGVAPVDAVYETVVVTEAVEGVDEEGEYEYATGVREHLVEEYADWELVEEHVTPAVTEEQHRYRTVERIEGVHEDEWPAYDDEWDIVDEHWVVDEEGYSYEVRDYKRYVITQEYVPEESYLNKEWKRWVLKRETIEHPAEYETVHHPAEYETIHHPAEYETIHHPEESHTEYEWKWWGNAHHGRTTWTDGSYPDLKGWGQGDWRKTGNTKKVVTKEAWSEEVLVKEAWSEEVLVKEAWSEEVLVKEAWTQSIWRGKWEYTWSQHRPGLGWVWTGKTERVVTQEEILEEGHWEYEYDVTEDRWAEYEAEGWKKYAKRTVEVPEVGHTEYDIERVRETDWTTEHPGEDYHSVEVIDQRTVILEEAYALYDFRRWVVTKEAVEPVEEVTEKVLVSEAVEGTPEVKCVATTTTVDRTVVEVTVDAPTDTQAGPRTLPRTGMNAGLALLGAGLLASGGTLVAAARRRNEV